MSRPAVVLFRSTNRNFPLDLEPELTGAGYSVSSLAGLSDYIASPARYVPQLVLVEVGSLADLDRAVLLFEWTEHVQPLAPARFLLVVASKNLPVGDRVGRIGNAELVVLPQPMRNLLFKLELQSRLLAQAKPAKASSGSGFAARLEEVHVAARPKRVLAVRGPGPAHGSWKEEGLAPSGKVRWRWVKPRAAASAGEELAWTAESGAPPRFDEKVDAWLLEGEDDKVTCRAASGEILYEQGSVPEDSGAESERPREEPPPAMAGDSTPAPEAGAASAVRFEESGSNAPKGPSPARASGAAEGAAVRFERAPAPGAEARAAHEASRVSGPAEKTAPEKGAPSPGEPPARENAATPRPAVEAVAGNAQAVSALERARAALAKAGSALGAEDAPAKPAAREATPASVPDRAAPGPAERPEKRARSYEVAERPVAPAREREPVKLDPSPQRRTRTEAERLAAERERKRGVAGELAAEAASERAASRAAAEPGAPAGDAPAARTAPEPLPSLGDDLPELSQLEPEPPIELPAAASEPAEPGASGTELDELPTFEPEPPVEEWTDEKVREALASAEAELSREIPSRAEPAGPAMAERVPPEAAPRPEPREKSAIDPGTAPERAARAAKMAVSRPNIAELVAEADLRAAANAPASDPRQFLRTRHFEVLTLEQLGDRESTWQPCGRYRIYLSADHRYYGIKEPASVLPLWVYEGELAPEFLDQHKAWKFYDRAPVLVSSLEVLPKDVLESLYRMCGIALPSEEKRAAPGAAAEPQKPAPEIPPGSARDAYAPEGAAAEKPGLWSRVKRKFGL